MMINNVVTAIYESGVLKPLQDIHLKEHQKVRIVVEPDLTWQRELRNLLKEIHQRTTKYSTAEIEKDITLASRRIKRSG